MRDAPIGAIYEWRADNLPLALGRAAGAPGRRGAGDRLRPRRERARRHACRRSAATPSSIRCESPGAGRSHRPCRFPGAGAAPPKAWARACTGRSSRREFLRNLGIEKRAAALKALAPPRQGRRDRRRGQAAARRRPHRDGHAVQGDRHRPSEARHAAGLRAACRMIGTPCCKRHRCPRLPGIRHGFFTRAGGVSEGLYESLNGGVGSEDAPAKVAENRARMAAALGVAPERFLTCYQIHSPRWWSPRRRGRRANGRAPTPSSRACRGLAIGVSTADCGPVLLADPQARRDRRGACRMARRAHRRDRGDGRRDGEARRRARSGSSPRPDR